MFDQIFDAIEEWMRELLTGMINSNLDQMFTDVNQKTGEIASQVGQTPQGWNGSIFSMIQNLSNSVILPIAGIIITFVLCYELISMLTERNNMHDIDTWMFFKYFVKMWIAVYLVSNTFTITMAVFDVGQHVVNAASGVVTGSTAIDISSALTDLEATLEAMEIGELVVLALETLIVSFCMRIMSVLITVILYGRMIEIYLYTYTSKYYKKLTVGRVQTPTLAMLVDRDRAVSSFQKEKYFNVELDLDGLQVERQKIFDEKEAEKLRVLCQGSDAVVEEIRSTDKTVRPPKLYDLTTLQREANRHYGMTAQQTLNAAQSLYEQKLITYPRTDSQYLTEDMEITAENVIRRIHEKYQLTGPFDQPEKPNVKLVLNNKKVSDHHAIIPTVELTDCDLSQLKDWEQKVLFLICVRMVEATEKDHIFTETDITVKCQNELFSAKKKAVKQMGWKLYEECFKNKDGLAMENPENVETDRFSDLTPGQIFYNVAADKSEHFTSPPKQYSEDLYCKG